MSLWVKKRMYGGDHLLPLHKRECLVTTNLPSLHPFSFHEMIFILVPPVFFRANVVVRAIAQPPFIQARTNNAAIAHAQTN